MAEVIPDKALAPDVLQLLEQRRFDFVDFGCSNGDSMSLAREAFGGREGIGIDIDPRKVETARAAGHNALVADATQMIAGRNLVRFCTMLHFLEHLPTKRAADGCIKVATGMAREFVYIRQPWFEGSNCLVKLGYKPYWSDWHGHQNHYTALDLINVLQRVRRVRRFLIFGKGRITSTRDAALVPLSAQRDRGPATVEEISRRENKPINDVIYREIVCLIQTGSPKQMKQPLALTAAGDHELVFDSSAGEGADTKGALREPAAAASRLSRWLSILGWR